MEMSTRIRTIMLPGASPLVDASEKQDRANPARGSICEHACNDAGKASKEHLVTQAPALDDGPWEGGEMSFRLRGQMPSHLGIDEAGLGPTLGPLCWGACAWSHQAPEDPMLWDALSPMVTAPGQAGELRLGDSKQVFSGAHRLRKLEEELLPWVSWSLQGLPSNVRGLWCALVGAADSRCPLTGLAQPPWFRDAFEQELPLRACRTKIEAKATGLAEKARTIGLERPRLGARVLSAAAFNTERSRFLELGGTKNNLATHHAGQLALRVSASAPELRSITFDKMGGRNRYTQQLAALWPTHEIITQKEGRDSSVYRLIPPTGEPFICSFVAKSESIYPCVALAACIAKYTRELVICAFQTHFSKRYPKVKPTAGYPQDARRFLGELRALEAPELFAPAQPTWIRQG